jgi:hypothetical protein
MRTITDHKVNGLNEAIEINAVGEPGSGGANVIYNLKLFPGSTKWVDETVSPLAELEIKFQNGPVGNSFNGFTNEALLAVLIDRMRGFQGMLLLTPEQQANPASIRKIFTCRENAIALTHLEEGLMWLQKRTRDRVARGVEGSLTP